MEEINLWLVLAGLFIGAVFGLLVQRFRFCMVAAINNFLLIRDNRQVLAFIAALLLGITGTQLLELNHIVAIADSSYRNLQLDWFGASFGGLIFGTGAVLTGGCATCILVKSAEGNLNAMIALLFFMLLAASTQFVFLETLRLELTLITAINLENDASIASLLGLPQWLTAVVVAIFLAGYLVKYWNSAAKNMVIGGFIIGALVVCSWYITGVLAQDEFYPVSPTGITISGPIARFGYILLSAKLPALSFAISFVIGILVTVFASALVTGRFRIKPVNKSMLLQTASGGSLMGIGGIMAYGCNIGQGLTGISTLSFESLLAVTGMFVGTVFGVIWKGKRNLSL